jgi:hypothetical protein
MVHIVHGILNKDSLKSTSVDGGRKLFVDNDDDDDDDDDHDHDHDHHDDNDNDNDNDDDDDDDGSKYSEDF